MIDGSLLHGNLSRPVAVRPGPVVTSLLSPASMGYCCLYKVNAVLGAPSQTLHEGLREELAHSPAIEHGVGSENAEVSCVSAERGHSNLCDDRVFGSVDVGAGDRYHSRRMCVCRMQASGRGFAEVLIERRQAYRAGKRLELVCAALQVVLMLEIYDAEEWISLTPALGANTVLAAGLPSSVHSFISVRVWTMTTG